MTDHSKDIRNALGGSPKGVEPTPPTRDEAVERIWRTLGAIHNQNINMREHIDKLRTTVRDNARNIDVQVDGMRRDLRESETWEAQAKAAQRAARWWGWVAVISTTAAVALLVMSIWGRT